MTTKPIDTRKLIDSLTPEQEAQLEVYFQEGVRVGLGTNWNLEEWLVRELTDSHRVMHGVPKATNFLVFDSVFQAIEHGPKGINQSNALYGQHEAGWLYNYKYYRDVLGLVEETKEISYLIELASHVNWMWMSSDTTIVTRQPTAVHTRPGVDGTIGTAKLHNMDSLAIEYKDGTGLYYMNDNYIPEDLAWVVTTPAEKLATMKKKVLAIKNVEIRNEAIKKVGEETFLSSIEKVLLEGKKKVLDSVYNLYQLDLGTPRTYLQSKCPSSGKSFFEAVHPDCKTVLQALNWRESGEVSDDYEIPIART